MLTINLLIILGGAILFGLFLLMVKKLDQREDFDSYYKNKQQQERENNDALRTNKNLINQY